MAVPEIPLDIILIVFERLDRLGERVVLARCSQVCRLWHPSARKVLASRAEIRPMAGDNVPNGSEAWTEWHGQLMRVPAEPSSIVWLSITEGDFFDIDWLRAALACLPRLRHLAVQVTERLQGFDFATVPSPFDTPLQSLTLYNYNSTLTGNGVCMLLRCFPEVNSVLIAGVRLWLLGDYDPDILCGIAPPSVSLLCGSAPGFQHVWYEILAQRHTARAIRHLRLGFPLYGYLGSASTVKLFENLTNLEVLELDLRGSLLDVPHSVRFFVSHCQRIQQQLGAVMPTTIHTLSLRLPREPEPHVREFSSLLCVSLLETMPPAIRHVEIRVEDWKAGNPWISTRSYAPGSNKHFDTERFAKCFERFRGLCEVAVVVKENEEVEDIAEYRAFLERGFPELAAHGVLRLRSEPSSTWPFDFR